MSSCGAKPDCRINASRRDIVMGRAQLISASGTTAAKYLQFSRTISREVDARSEATPVYTSWTILFCILFKPTLRRALRNGCQRAACSTRDPHKLERQVSAAILRRNISAIRRAFELSAGPDCVNELYLQEAYWACPCRCHVVTCSVLQFQDICRIIASE